GARVPKHRQILDDALGLSRGEVSLLAVLALRGPQTVGELRTRTERMHDFNGLSGLEETLEGLAARDEPLVVRLERQPGQKEARYAQLLGGPVDAGAYAHSEPGVPAHAAAAETQWREEARPAAAAGPAVPGPPAGGSASSDRVAALEARLASVEADLAILQAEHQELREELGVGGGARPAVAEPD
ncbi:MAG TPA: DUF480 domain-containing protein, partial [Acidimicrobiia bacterium]|nr:DUF480 domain-containing protein [Acidimicrobiia bacterium]